MKGLHILRHNEAVRVIAQSIRLSPTMGTGTIIMDAGVAQDASIAHSFTEIPQDFFGLPEPPPSKPDIVIVPGITWDPSKPSPTPSPTNPVHIFEVGYCGDTRVLDKVEQKKQQHAALTQALEKAGWTVHNHIIPLGIGGSIYNPLAPLLMDTLGLSRSLCNTQIRQIQHITSHRAFQLYKTRRHLEYKGIREHRPP
jgi:hypothetical protein